VHQAKGVNQDSLSETGWDHKKPEVTPASQPWPNAPVVQSFPPLFTSQLFGARSCSRAHLI
jgi:hypothetical protein